MPLLHRHRLAIVILTVVACRAQAAFDGLPIAATNYTWDYANSVAICSQLWEAATERCIITGVQTPTNVDTWAVYWGTSTTYRNITNGIGTPTTNIITVTNTWLVSTNIVVTNWFGPFKYVDEGGSNRTAYPYVTHSFFETLDATLTAITTNFVSTNEYTANRYNDWFGKAWTNAGATNYVTDYPYENQTHLFSELGIGKIYGATTNAVGYITGGTSWWTRQVARTSDWQLAQMSYGVTGFSSSAWIVNITASLSDYFFFAQRPVIRYTTPSTNALLAYSIRLVGYTISDDPTVRNIQSITYSVTTSNTILPERWSEISEIQFASGPPANAVTGTTFRVVWPGYEMAGDIPYFIDKTFINERVAYLKALVWTTHGNYYWTNSIDAAGEHWTTGGTNEEDFVNWYTDPATMVDDWLADQPPWDKLAWWDLDPPGPWSDWPTYKGEFNSDRTTNNLSVEPSYAVSIAVTLDFHDTSIWESCAMNMTDPWSPYTGPYYQGYPPWPDMCWYTGEEHKNMSSYVTNSRTTSLIYEKGIPTNAAHQDEWYIYETSNAVTFYPIAYWSEDLIANSATSMSDYYDIDSLVVTGAVVGSYLSLCETNMHAYGQNVIVGYGWENAQLNGDYLTSDGHTWENAGNGWPFYATLTDPTVEGDTWVITFYNPETPPAGLTNCWTNANIGTVEGPYAYDPTRSSVPDPGEDIGNFTDAIWVDAYQWADINYYCAQGAGMNESWTKTKKTIKPLMKWNVTNGLNRY